jgi:hypothetical protein
VIDVNPSEIQFGSVVDRFNISAVAGVRVI